MNKQLAAMPQDLHLEEDLVISETASALQHLHRVRCHSRALVAEGYVSQMSSKSLIHQSDLNVFE